MRSRPGWDEQSEDVLMDALVVFLVERKLEDINKQSESALARPHNSDVT